MNLAEFYAEIMPKNIDIEKIKTSIQNRVISNPTKSYYGSTP